MPLEVRKVRLEPLGRRRPTRHLHLLGIELARRYQGNEHAQKFIEEYLGMTSYIDIEEEKIFSDARLSEIGRRDGQLKLDAESRKKKDDFIQRVADSRAHYNKQYTLAAADRVSLNSSGLVEIVPEPKYDVRDELRFQQIRDRFERLDRAERSRRYLQAVESRDQELVDAIETTPALAELIAPEVRQQADQIRVSRSPWAEGLRQWGEALDLADAPTGLINRLERAVELGE